VLLLALVVEGLELRLLEGIPLREQVGKRGGDGFVGFGLGGGEAEVGVLDLVLHAGQLEANGGECGRTCGAAAATASRRSWLIGQVVKWFVFLIFVELAVEALGLSQLSELLHRVILWIPNLVVAILVLVLGALLARFVARLVHGAATAGRVGNPNVLGRIVEFGIIALAAVVALNQLGIGAVFVDILFAAVIGALALATGLAFGLGGQKVASRMWRDTYRATQTEVTTLPPTRPLPDEKTPIAPQGRRQQ